MKVLLRSTFLADPVDNEDQFLQNYQSLQASDLGFDNAADNAVWAFVQDFVSAHRHIPDHSTVKAHFDRLGAMEVADRLEHLRVLPAKTRGDFVRRLEERADERRVRLVTDILKEAGHIVSQGIEIDDGKEKKLLRGPIDAMRFIMDKGHDVVTPTTGIRLSGNVTQRDGAPFAHLHATLGGPDLETLSGHLMRAVCAITVEAMVTPLTQAMHRGDVDDFCGLRLIDLPRRDGS